MTRIGILGGTFDPIHLGHLIIASFAASELHLDRVLFMPAQTPPHKAGRAVTDARHRVEMVRLAIDPDARFELSDLDLQSSAPSYTSELLQRAQHRFPGASLHFIVGADSLRDFPTWHEPDLILDLAELAVARRHGIAIEDETFEALPRLRECTSIFSSPLIDISSTGIRQRALLRQPITWLVPDPVERYILERGLYGAR